MHLDKRGQPRSMKRTTTKPTQMVTVEVTRQIWKQIKMRAIEEERYLPQVIDDALSDYLAKATK
jgi:hypothetical protein